MSTNLLFPDTPRLPNDPRDWDWEAAIKECLSNDVIEDRYGDCRYYSLFLGTVMSLAPSGRYWTCWACNNVTQEEADRDEEYFEILDNCADEAGGWIENGEGDPCDLFFCLPQQDSEELDESMDGNHESALASAGFGTDEDYGGCDDRL